MYKAIYDMFDTDVPRHLIYQLDYIYRAKFLSDIVHWLYSGIENKIWALSWIRGRRLLRYVA